MTEAIENQVIAVVGGTKGIGEAIVTDLAEAGARVVVAGRDQAASARIAADIGEHGGEAVAIACDVTSTGDCERLIEEVAERFGQLDTLFANQGVAGPLQPLTDWSETAVSACLEVNLIGCLRLAKASRELLAADGGGRFIVTGSGSGHENISGLGMYGISKAAVSHLVRQLSIEWRSQRIAVNELIPGPVRTEMTGYNAQGTDDTSINPMEGIAESMGEWLKHPADVAPLARFLAGLPTNGPSGQIFSLSGRV